MTAIPEKRKQKAELYNHPGFLPESNFRTTAKGQEKPRGAPQPHWVEEKEIRVQGGHVRWNLWGRVPERIEEEF